MRLFNLIVMVVNDYNYTVLINMTFIVYNGAMQREFTHILKLMFYFFDGNVNGGCAIFFTCV